jgi:hypothetical protein
MNLIETLVWSIPDHDYIRGLIDADQISAIVEVKNQFHQADILNKEKPKTEVVLSGQHSFFLRESLDEFLNAARKARI